MNASQKRIIKRVAATLIILAAIGFVGVMGLFFAVKAEIIGELPDTLELLAIENPNASDLYASDGQLVTQYFIENRTDLEPHELSKHFTDALIATEDVRFYEHAGIDFRSLMRVAVKSVMLQQRSSGGGSTLTQQLAKNLYPREQYRMMSTVMNKFREMAIAQRLERLYSKDEILLLYCNTVSFGELAFGLQTGARRFFDKAPSELLIEEAATLVGMLKAPTYYSPRLYPERAQQRRDVVINQMAKYGFITPQAAEELHGIPLRVRYTPSTIGDNSSLYFKEMVKHEFNEWSRDVNKPDGGKYNIYTDGLKIYTTLDVEMQRAAEKTMQQHMRKLQKLFLASWKNGKMYGKDTRIIDGEIHKTPIYQRMKTEGASKEEILAEFTTKDKRRVWTWDGFDEEHMTRIDSIKHYLSLLHSGIIAVDPLTGEVKTWVGGNDYRKFQYDNITGARQVGSTFKPIVYLTALEQGVRPCDYYENERHTYPDYRNWSPQNSDGEYGGHMTVQSALANSVNTISVQVLFEAGIDNTIEMARRLGIESSLDAVPSIVLGTSDVSLYEIARAYSSFANGGFPSDLHAIKRIEDADGNVLYEYDAPITDRIVEPYLIDQLNSMLSGVTLEGTGQRLYQEYGIPFQVLGKTGTTQNQSDGLFVGYTDRLLIAAWVGTKDRRIHFRNLGTGSGGRTAMPMVGELFEYAAEQGFAPDDDDLGHPYACPPELPGRDFALKQLAYVESMIDQMTTEWNTDIDVVKAQRKKIARKDKEARKQASAEIAKLKRQQRERLEAYKRQRDHWKRVLRELED